MTRTIANPERGCGHLKHGKAYVRGVIGSPDGILPSFVRFDPPIPYREMGTDETFTRGYLRFDGTAAQFHLNQLADFDRCYPGDLDDSDAVDNMLDRGLYADRDAVPDSEPQRHVDRIAARRVDADHFGEVDLAAHGKRPHADLLMRVGATHYPTPDDYIQEAIDLGISKAIPLSKRQDPPVVEPGVTRIWVVHPDTDVGWGVIGFAYLQEVVYTQQDDGTVPDYIQDHAAAGELDVVDIEPPKSHQDDTDVTAWADQDGGDGSTADDDGGKPADDDANPGGDTGEDRDAGDWVLATPDWLDQDTDVVSLGDLSYNDLKRLASQHDIDAGPSPTRDELEQAIIDYDPDTDPNTDD